MIDRSTTRSNGIGATAASAPRSEQGTGRPAGSDLHPLLDPVEQLITEHPVVFLASALALGAALAWWIKRT